jgi:peptidoglycan hydrolase-like protein with peptidoglycan-binding domain
MGKKLLVVLVVALIVLPIALFGCKSKTEKMPEEMKTEVSETPMETQEAQVTAVTEPAETVATETIPPTAAPQVQVVEKPALAVPTSPLDRPKEIQTALKKAGYYAGAIDGKIGPKTMKAIEEFQKAKGLKVDGKVGPRTWAELEKYLTR